MRDSGLDGFSAGGGRVKFSIRERPNVPKVFFAGRVFSLFGGPVRACSSQGRIAHSIVPTGGPHNTAGNLDGNCRYDRVQPHESDALL